MRCDDAVMCDLDTIPQLVQVSSAGKLNHATLYAPRLNDARRASANFPDCAAFPRAQVIHCSSYRLQLVQVSSAGKLSHATLYASRLIDARRASANFPDCAALPRAQVIYCSLYRLQLMQVSFAGKLNHATLYASRLIDARRASANFPDCAALPRAQVFTVACTAYRLNSSCAEYNPRLTQLTCVVRDVPGIQLLRRTL